VFHRTVRLVLLFPLPVCLLFGQLSSSVTLGISPNPVTYGRPVTMTATVIPGATGKVTFYDGPALLGIAAISAGQAVLSTTLLPSGARSLRAHYSGDSTYLGSDAAAVA